MKLIFFLSIVTTIFTLGKAKECYSCIVDSEDNNKTSLSDSIASLALVVGDTIPTEYCNISTDFSSYITCTTPRFCVKGVVENSYGETLLYFCQGKAELPYLELDDPKIIIHSHFKMTLYSCDADLCNAASAFFVLSANTYYSLLMTLFFIRKF